MNNKYSLLIIIFFSVLYSYGQCSPDVTPPSITCPGNVTAACPHAVPSLAPTTSDFCGAVVLQTYTLTGATSVTSGSTGINDASSEIFLAGITTVTYYIEDVAGNSASCNFTVNVTDNIPPVVVCKDDIITVNDSGNCTAVVNMYAFGVFPTAADTCSGISTIATNVPPGSAFPVGTTTVTWLVTDLAGNFQTCTQDVTVTDEEDPTIICPANVTANAIAGQCNATVTIPLAIPSDNCAITSITNDYNGGGADASDTYPLGTTTVTFTATDSVNRTVTCSFDVTVINTQSPIITLIGANPQTIEACSPYVELGATATDNCLGDISSSIVIDASNVNINAVGTYNVTYNVTNAGGVSATQIIRTVNVVDTTSPTMSLNGPDPLIIGDCSTYTELGALALDGCLGDISANVVINNASVDTSVLGSYTVTYNVTDDSGNTTAQITRVVTVIDITGPVITLIGADPQTMEGCSPYMELGATALDPCFGIDYSADMVVDSSAIIPNVIGSYPVTYNVMDVHGNSAMEVIRTVDIVDTTGPVITLNGADPQIIEACSPYVELGATALDPCFLTDYSGDIIMDASTVNTAVVGAYNVTYNVMDVHGNPAAEVIRTVDVIDTTLPAITCPEDITVGNDTNLCSAVVNYTTPVGTDSCSPVTTTQIAGIPSGGIFPVGTTINTFEVQDDSGNTATCSFNVIIGDTEAPTIICPADITGSNDAGLCSALINYTTPVGADNCVGQTTIQIAGLPSGSIFPLGATTNTFQVTDAAGNTATCSFDVIINDTENPVATCQDISIQLDPVTGTATIVPADIDNSSSDNCTVNLSLSTSAFDCSHIGANLVTLTVTDAAGNLSTCEATVTITDLSENASVSVVSSATTICENESVTFTATPVNGGTNPNYQWQINGVDVSGETGATFSSSTFLNGDQVTVLMTSDLSICAQPQVSNIITIIVNDYNAPANAGPDYVNAICTDTSITLAGNAITGSGTAGLWTVSSGQVSGFSFSDPTSPTSTFIGDIGETYTLTWSLDNPAPCPDTTDTMTIDFIGCNALDFDGVDDNITFRDNYNLSGDFSVEIWIKSEATNGNVQTIFSKREANNQVDGYDLRLVNGVVSFHWNNGQSLSSTPIQITQDIWYHIAVTFNSGTYKLYIDGIEVQSTAGVAPTSNNVDCILGAMDQTLVAPFQPLNYFDGGMDELRIWNVALSETQIRKMMNQEIEDNTSVVRGSIVPIDIAGLSWNNLNGYYQMNQIVDISSGNLTANSTPPIDGVLRYMTTLQAETAPLPYKSVANNSWSNSNTWLYGNSQSLPNSMGIDGTTPVDWNIVRTSHQITSGNKNITLLGLDVNSNTFSIENTDPMDGQSLRITDYLLLDGTLDLVGESQLLQDTGSIVDINSTGTLQRDQQGTSNYFNYNYWSSPVNSTGTSYTINSILRDGTNTNNPQNLQWTSNHDADASTNPITLSSRWLYSFENYPINSYADWRFIGENASLNIGLGFTMKGSGAASSNQNYVFVGKPNNGTISTPIISGNEALVGNPYPSAMDAHEFINDNSSSILGALYFWEHSNSNTTHILSDYEGGYASYNLTGGNAAVSPPEINGIGDALKIPERFVPVGQGFFVEANATGGTIQFENDQRIFVKEAVTGAADNGSVFMRNINTNRHTSEDQATIQRIRIAFKTPEGARRPLLLGFVPNQLATDGFDYGYDAINTESFPNDMSWMISEEKYTTQGVGAFDVSKQYPLGIFLNTSGFIEIALLDIENFDAEIDVFVYDAWTNTSFQINNSSFTMALENNNYRNRFFITFQPTTTLSLNDPISEEPIFMYLDDTNEIYIKLPPKLSAKSVSLFNSIGQEVMRWEQKDLDIVNEEIRIKTKSLSEGIYILKLTTSDNSVESKKIIIKY